MSAEISAAFLSVLAWLGLAANGPGCVQGYAEAEYVLVAPQLSGTLEALMVKRGEQVQKDQFLFALDNTAERAALHGAKATVLQKKAQLEDLLKGKRKPELDALLAQREQASAAFELARTEFERDSKTRAARAISEATFDKSRTNLAQAKAKLEEAEAALATGQQSLGRDDAIRAAQASLKEAEAAEAKAAWALEQKTRTAPVKAFVFDTLFNPGEYIPAGQPVVSLLPPENIKVRFFVSGPDLEVLRIEEEVSVQTETQTLAAKIDYLSPEAEYTPPVLFNRDNRAKLLYRVEAVPLKNPQLLHPGQPVDVCFLKKTLP